MADLARVWKALPPAVRYPLLVNGSGADRLLRIAHTLADAVNADSSDPDILKNVLCDTVTHAWELDPFAQNAAGLVLQLHAQMPFLTPSAAAFCAACKALRTDFLDQGKAVGAMLEAGDTDSAKAVLERMAEKEPGNLFWFRFAAHLGFFWNELDWFEPWLATPTLPPAIAARFRADYFFARSAWDKARTLYASAFAETGLTECLVRAGECAKRAGQRETAAELWHEALARRPWQVNLVHRLHDLEQNRDLPGNVPPGNGEVFLYSWNNARELDKTLASLAASETGNAAFTALDNGSRDGTGEVVAAWADRLGDRF
ncbi:glycosyltransferase family 2 protein, partial [Desulfovibrio sp. OttesenSCG-928-O18]|nr:glycosyltransferase family 2 protein [Desulfovibrio sp. OttesenSCG-928-O18]